MTPEGADPLARDTALPPAAPNAAAENAVSRAKPKLLRQFELIDKVRSYDPSADENRRASLNVAAVSS